MSREEAAKLIYGIVKQKGQTGITLFEIRNLPQAKGVPAHSILLQLCGSQHVTTVIVKNKMHYVAK